MLTNITTMLLKLILISFFDEGFYIIQYKYTGLNKLVYDYAKSGL